LKGNKMAIDTLIEKIGKAFDTLEKSGNVNLVKEIEQPESQEMLSVFADKHWKDIDIQVADYWKMNLVRFTSVGFQYFLPAFLIASLNNEEPTEIDVYIVNSLTPRKELVANKSFIERISLLNQEQKSVIFEYLKVFFDDNPTLKSNRIREQILEFWRQETD
jgi:Family of unknown function (DUF6714)